MQVFRGVCGGGQTIFLKLQNWAVRLPSCKKQKKKTKTAWHVNLTKDCVKVCVTPVCLLSCQRTNTHQKLNATLTVNSFKFAKAYYLHLSRRTWTLRCPHILASNGCRPFCLSFALVWAALLCCTFLYLQILCGQVSGWNAKIGHLLGDRAH